MLGASWIVLPQQHKEIRPVERSEMGLRIVLHNHGTKSYLVWQRWACLTSQLSVYFCQKC